MLATGYSRQEQLWSSIIICFAETRKKCLSAFLLYVLRTMSKDSQETRLACEVEVGSLKGSQSDRSSISSRYEERVLSFFNLSIYHPPPPFLLVCCFSLPCSSSSVLLLFFFFLLVLFFLLFYTLLYSTFFFSS